MRYTRHRGMGIPPMIGRSRCLVASSRFCDAPARSRAFAFITVILMMSLIAGAVAALAVLFATEARRTRAAVEGAQLRQLLLAAAPLATEELRLGGPAAREVPVPTPIATDTLTLQIKPLDTDHAQVQVIAKSPNSHADLTLIYLHQGSAWQLQAAALTAQR
jgi:hypothetical protein